MQKFKMFRWAAGAVEGTGWCCIVVGAIMLLSGLSSCSQPRGMSVEGLISLLGGIIPIAVGELLVLCGQGAKCFLAIEENIRDLSTAMNGVGSVLRQAAGGPEASTAPPPAAPGGQSWSP